MNPKAEQVYMRALIGARLANKDNWVVIFAGSKKFVRFQEQRLPSLQSQQGGVLAVGPLGLVAGDIAGHPTLWVLLVAQPKATDPIEAEKERRGNAEVLGLMGSNEPLRSDKDIFALIEPGAPKWAGRLIHSFIDFIETGEGTVPPAP